MKRRGCARRHAYAKKGFTLVELIVVLVVLGILLALLIPSLIKYIDKAKEKQIIVNGRYAYLAAQMLASEKYAASVWIAPERDEVLEMAGVDGEIVDMTFTQAGIVDVTEERPFRYKENGITAKYADGQWTIEDGKEAGGGGAGEPSIGVGSVTLTDSKGVRHVITPSVEWMNIKATIANGGHVTPGSILTDSVGTCVYYAWNDYLYDANAANYSLEEFADAHPDRLVKFSEDSKIWILEDAFEYVPGSYRWKKGSVPQKGDLLYLDEKIYVSPTNRRIGGEVETGSWILIK